MLYSYFLNFSDKIMHELPQVQEEKSGISKNA